MARRWQARGRYPIVVMVDFRLSTSEVFAVLRYHAWRASKLDVSASASFVRTFILLVGPFADRSDYFIVALLRTEGAEFAAGRGGKWLLTIFNQPVGIAVASQVRITRADNFGLWPAERSDAGRLIGTRMKC